MRRVYSIPAPAIPESTQSRLEKGDSSVPYASNHGLLQHVLPQLPAKTISLDEGIVGVTTAEAVTGPSRPTKGNQENWEVDALALENWAENLADDDELAMVV
jgi:hypothetical protein